MRAIYILIALITPVVWKSLWQLINESEILARIFSIKIPPKGRGGCAEN